MTADLRFAPWDPGCDVRGALVRSLFDAFVGDDPTPPFDSADGFREPRRLRTASRRPWPDHIGGRAVRRCGPNMLVAFETRGPPSQPAGARGNPPPIVSHLPRDDARNDGRWGSCASPRASRGGHGGAGSVREYRARERKRHRRSDVRRGSAALWSGDYQDFRRDRGRAARRIRNGWKSRNDKRYA